MTAGPDPQRALARYREHAAGYDASALRTLPLRYRTIWNLALQPGDRLLLRVALGLGGLERLQDGFETLPGLRQAAGEAHDHPLRPAVVGDGKAAPEEEGYMHGAGI